MNITASPSENLSKFKAWNLSTKIYLILGVLLVLLIFAGILSMSQARNLEKKISKTYVQELIPMETLDDIKASFYRIRERAGRHIHEPERQLIHEKKIKEQLERIIRNEKKYHRSKISKDEQSYIASYQLAWQNYLYVLNDKIFPLSRNGQAESAEKLLYGEALMMFRKARYFINLLVDHQLKQAGYNHVHSKAEYIMMEANIIFILLVTFLLGVGLYLYRIQVNMNRRLAESILTHSSHGVMVTDVNLKIQWVNSAFEKASGYTAKDVFMKTPRILYSGKHKANFYKVMWDNIKNKGGWEGEIWNRKKSGDIYPELLNIIPLKNKKGIIERYAGIFVDLSTIKKVEKKAHKLEFYDPVTGLANASMLGITVKRLFLSKNSKKIISVICLDIDSFHEINVGIGRDIGDEVLKEVGQRLFGLKKGAVEARISGDEFVIAYAMNSNSKEEAMQSVRAFVSIIRMQFERPILIGLNEIMLTCSIGVSVELIERTSAATILQQASIALSYSKHNMLCGSGLQFYNDEIDKKIKYRQKLSHSIVKAIDNNELFLLYQPQVNSNENIISAEVLLRWKNKEFGLVAPDIFVNIAEEHGFMVEIGRWVFENTLKQMVLWRDAGMYQQGLPIQIAINISPYQILADNVAEDFYNICLSNNFQPDTIELELTETSISGLHSEKLLDNLHALSRKGFKISIDDFGTGHSSLSRLRNFPGNTLKIDREFVNNMHYSSSDLAIVESIVNIAHTFDFTVIAEGVENKMQLDLLNKLGCDLYQGFYFSKPLTADAYACFCEKRYHH